MPVTKSYAVKIEQQLTKLSANRPDAKDNAGNVLGEVFFWKEVARIAEKRAKAAMDEANKLEVIPSSDAIKKSHSAGSYSLAESPNFAATARVSKPPRRFDIETFAGMLMKSKYKVPDWFTKKAYEDAKVEGNPSVTITVSERV